MNIGLFFGSFNPAHIGHLAIANYMLEFTPIDKIWFVVSPQNPLKEKKSFIDEKTRLHLLQKIIGKNKNYEVKDIEFQLPTPSYTINTLEHLKQKYPYENFIIIMGEDNFQFLPKWKNHKHIVTNYSIYVYPRKNAESKQSLLENNNIKKIDAPIIEISSSFIRTAIKDGKDVRYFLPNNLFEDLKQFL